MLPPCCCSLGPLVASDLLVSFGDGKLTLPIPKSRRNPGRKSGWRTKFILKSQFVPALKIFLWHRETWSIVYKPELFIRYGSRRNVMFSLSWFHCDIIFLRPWQVQIFPCTWPSTHVHRLFLLCWFSIFSAFGTIKLFPSWLYLHHISSGIQIMRWTESCHTLSYSSTYIPCHI